MQEPTLKDLRIFVAVATTGSFRQGAKSVDMAPSSVSHAVAGLERRFNVRLFNRSTRSVALTEAGAAFLARIQPLLHDMSVAFGEVDTSAQGVMGTLRINAPFMSIALLIAQVIPEFLAQHPGITLDIRHEDRPVDIVSHGSDAGIRLGDDVPPDMIGIPFGPAVRFIPVASPAYLRRFGTPDHPSALHDHACIRIRLPSGDAYAWEFENGGTRTTIDVSGRLMLDRMPLMVAAAQEGLGIAFVLEHAVCDLVKAGTLVPLLRDWTSEEPGLMLYYPGRRQVPRPLRAFIDHLKTCDW
jgi:DNA-binding transcriptional LysR family regulator